MESDFDKRIVITAVHFLPLRKISIEKRALVASYSYKE